MPHLHLFPDVRLSPIIESLAGSLKSTARKLGARVSDARRNGADFSTSGFLACGDGRTNLSVPRMDSGSLAALPDCAVHVRWRPVAIVGGAPRPIRSWLTAVAKAPGDRPNIAADRLDHSPITSSLVPGNSGALIGTTWGYRPGHERNQGSELTAS